MFAVDDFGRLFDVLFCTTGIVALLLSRGRQALDRAEYVALVLFATAGMSILARAENLVVLFLGLELLSIVSYALTGFVTGRPQGPEAALKYFFLGAFASAFVVYGSALVYGATGALHYDGIGSGIATDAAVGPLAAVLVGAVILFIGLAFKISAVPFHAWTPDVYEGAPTPVAAFMSVATKAAAFAALLRLLLGPLAGLIAHWRPVVAALAVATMVVGNLVALRQLKLKRMLAYSSIAHAGYGLLGLVAAGAQGATATVFYLFAYAAMNLGAFSVVAMLERDDGSLRVSDLDGLHERRPVAAFVMALFLLSLAGVPPTAGFVGKFYLFLAMVESGWWKLAVVAVVYAAIAAYYYLRVIVHMYMEPEREGDALPTFPPAGAAVVGVAAVLVILLGLAPTAMYQIVAGAVSAL